MTATERAIPRQFILVLLTIVAIVPDSQGQDDTAGAGVRIIWKKGFDGSVKHRRYYNRSEPDVGISPDRTRANPVRMVVSKSLYLLDARGDVERRITLRENRQERTREFATTAPNGEFYIIRTLVWSRDGHGISRLRAFNVDGSPRFEFVASELMQKEPPRYLGELYGTYIAPDAEYMVIFYNAWGISPYPFLDFYDTRHGELIKHIGRDFFKQNKFSPFELGFSEDGKRVILNGFKTEDLLEFDARGDFRRRIAGDVAARKAARQARDAMKRKLEPKAVEARLDRGHHTGGIAEYGLLRDRNLGMYSRGDTLYLFEVAGSREEEIEDAPR